MDRRGFIAGCLGLPLLANLSEVRAQGTATKIIFPFAAGGGGDTLCRVLGQRLGQVDGSYRDRRGSHRRRRADRIRAVKGANPDGATVLVTTGPTMYLLPMVETEPSFNTEKDFVPVSLLARFEFAIVTGPSVEAEDFVQFAAWLKAHSDQATFGVPSNGTIPHFMGSRLEQVLTIPLTRVPYRGSAPIINDLIGGHLPFGITTLSDAIPQHRAGGVKIIAVSSAARSPFLPEVPTLTESGIDLVADGWYGMWLPAGSSPDLAGKLSTAASTALSETAVKDKLLAIGLIPVGTAPQGLTQELAANTAFWQPIVKATGYKITD